MDAFSRKTENKIHNKDYDRIVNVIEDTNNDNNDNEQWLQLQKIDLTLTRKNISALSGNKASKFSEA